MYNDKCEPVLIQKLLIRVPPREVHNEMLKPIDKGGFDGARDAVGNAKSCCAYDQKIQGNVCL